MKNYLLIKITSMGDLIQMLPGLTDAGKAIPGIKFDWVIEESFVEIAKLHPNVGQIISLPYRRWKKNYLESIRSKEISKFLSTLRAQHYDMVIDAQSNLKSAFVTFLAKGKKYGLDSTSVREYGAHWAYDKKITISRQQNHAHRMRQLMATFLDYELLTTPADYGILKEKLPAPNIELPSKYIFITAISSSKIRLWPEPFWKEVINHVLELGYEIVLPWWSQEEKERTTRLKQQDPRVHLLPPLSLTEKTSILSKAFAAISIDTGLAHMAAALNIPQICLYGATDPELTGAVGLQQIHIRANGPACSPCLRMACHYKGESTHKPACLETILPSQVITAVNQFLENISLRT